MICEQCGEEIEDGEEYSYIEITDKIVCEECTERYLYSLVEYKTRSKADEEWAYKEDCIDRTEV